MWLGALMVALGANLGGGLENRCFETLDVPISLQLGVKVKGLLWRDCTKDRPNVGCLNDMLAGIGVGATNPA